MRGGTTWRIHRQSRLAVAWVDQQTERAIAASEATAILGVPCERIDWLRVKTLALECAG